MLSQLTDLLRSMDEDFLAEQLEKFMSNPRAFNAEAMQLVDMHAPQLKVFARRFAEFINSEIARVGAPQKANQAIPLASMSVIIAILFNRECQMARSN